MLEFLHRIFSPTKDIRIQNRHLFVKISCLMIASFTLLGLFSDEALAASGLKIYNYQTKKESTYTDKQIKVTLNGKTIGNSNTPGILVNGIALLPYKDIFEDSNIAAECIYNKDKGTVSITKNNITIGMKIGSKSATVNGKAVTLPVAPMKIKYVKANVAKVLVPSRFVSEALGFGYAWYSEKNTVAIEKKSMLISFNNGDKFEYTGAQCKVTIDGQNVDLGSMPNIITNNTAMLRAKKVFADSKIKAIYKYNKDDNTVTLTKNNNTLVMTIGSTTAYLNGKSKKMDVAPILVKNYDSNSSYVMVPGLFTATCLGYDYTWNNSTRTSVITSKGNNTSGSGNTNTDPELGDNGVIVDTGTILYQWNGLDTLYGKSSGVHGIESSGNASVADGMIYSVSRDYSNIKQNTETYMITSTEPFQKLTSNYSGNKITLQAEHMYCSDLTYQLYGVSSNYINTISTYFNTQDTSTTIEVELLQDKYSYDISLSQDRLTLYVTVYMNTVTKAVIGTNTAGDYITLTGNTPLNATVTQASGCLYIDLPNTTNSLGDMAIEVKNTKYINQFITVNNQDRIQYILIMNEGYQYYIMESGNNYTLSFQPNAAVQQDDIPDVIDKSKYEIVIPRPSGVTDSMISNEDFYFDNYFVIRMQGDSTAFFSAHPATYNSGVIKKITYSVNSSGETEIKIATTKLQGYEIASDNDYIYVNIGDPREIYKNIVVLDPGHGGDAKGARYFNTNEKDVNFQILYTIGKKYFNKNTSELKVYYTRTSDVDMTLNNRAAFAKKVGADLFVSLHMNASEASAAKGTEVYYSKNNNSANAAGLTSEILAGEFLTSINGVIGSKNRGVKSAAYVVVHKNTVPAVLIELGFLSNKEDFAKITDATYQENVAKAIYDTLLQVFKEYPTGR